MKSFILNKKRSVLTIMGLLSILSVLTGCHYHKLDGPGMERMGPELVNVTDVSKIEGYWSEDCIGYVFEIFGNQVIVRNGIIQEEADVVKQNGKLWLTYGELISSPNNQVYGYISDFRYQEDDTILVKVYLENLDRTDEHILRRVDYPYSYERLDSLLEEIAGTYVSDFGEEVTIKKTENAKEKTGLSRHDCGYTMTIQNSQEEKSREDFFLGKKKYNDKLVIVNTSDFSEGFIVRKNADGEYELVALIIEMGEDEYKTMEEIYIKR